MRRTPGRRDSQTFQPYLPEGAVEDKVRCHNEVVTDVTKQWSVAGGQWPVRPWAPPLFVVAAHLKSRDEGLGTGGQ